VGRSKEPDGIEPKVKALVDALVRHAKRQIAASLKTDAAKAKQWKALQRGLKHPPHPKPVLERPREAKTKAAKRARRGDRPS